MTNVRSIRVAEAKPRLLFPTATCLAGLLISFLGLATSTFADSATLAWDRVSSHTNLSTYILKYGPTSGSYTGAVNVATNLTSGIVNNLVAGRRYFFVVTARNVSGIESDPSNEIAYTVPGTGTNAPPIANAASTSTSEDQPKSITLTGSDPEGDSLAYTVVTLPANARLP